MSVGEKAATSKRERERMVRSVLSFAPRLPFFLLHTAPVPALAL